ncbi:MAG TPA: hypothetical protein GXX29_02830 [Firmicutes bacterium]|nr:hypothetical protein [Bacillota bacterium]
MRVGRICGVGISCHKLFLLLLVVFSAAGLLPEMLMIFLLVILHETAHMLVARAYGLAVEELELLPFGGVARIDGLMETDPAVEIPVALAGPLMSLLLAACGRVFLVPLLEAVGPVSGPAAGPAVAEVVAATAAEEWAHLFVQTNFLLAAFNLVPALPLDGGRLLRAGLAGKIGYRRATQWAALAGKVFAVLLMAAGVVGLAWRLGLPALLSTWSGGRLHLPPVPPLPGVPEGAGEPGTVAAAATAVMGDGTGLPPALLLLGFFIFSAAAKEQREAMYVLIRYLSRKQDELKKHRCLESGQLVTADSTKIGEVLKHFVPRHYHLVWVLDESGKINGLVTEFKLIDMLFEKGFDQPIGALIDDKEPPVIF